jgi:hypothetical protein
MFCLFIPFQIHCWHHGTEDAGTLWMHRCPHCHVHDPSPRRWPNYAWIVCNQWEYSFFHGLPQPQWMGCSVADGAVGLCEVCKNVFLLISYSTCLQENQPLFSAKLCSLSGHKLWKTFKLVSVCTLHCMWYIWWLTQLLAWATSSRSKKQVKMKYASFNTSIVRVRAHKCKIIDWIGKFVNPSEISVIE